MDPFILAAFFTIAYFYSSVGHGGASGYLALMALLSMDPSIMRASALTLNLFVAGTAFIMYWRGGYFRLRTVLPFLVTSMPFAFLGARLQINPTIYKIILGIFLLIAVGRMLFLIRPVDKKNEPPVMTAVIIGTVLGFFSGMIGIGGGIILTPLLLLLRWANVKEAAAASAIFIFLNSSTGLIGLYSTGFSLHPDIYAWIFAALAGGLLGSYTGSFRFSLKGLTYLLAVVLMIASAKLFFL